MMEMFYHYIIENMENIIVINDASVMEMFIFICSFKLISTLYIYILCVCDILIHMHVFGDVACSNPHWLRMTL